jgi:hypothetical protein
MATTQSVTKVEIRYVPAEKIGTVFGQVLMNDRSGYLKPEEMDLVDMPGLDHTKRPANHPKNLETIYKHYQSIDGTEDERTKQLKSRSMSYGDCIVIQGKAYYVASEGFVYIDDDDKVQPVNSE